MTDTLDGLVADPNLPGSYSVAQSASNLPITEVAPVPGVVPAPKVTQPVAPVGGPLVQAVASDPNAPVTLKQLVNAFQVFAPPAAIPVPAPGSTTTEFKLAGAVCTFLSVVSALLVGLSASGVSPLSPEVTGAVLTGASAVIGWVTTNYVNSRTAVKVANSNPPKA